MIFLHDLHEAHELRNIALGELLGVRYRESANVRAAGPGPWRDLKSPFMARIARASFNQLSSQWDVTTDFAFFPQRVRLSRKRGFRLPPATVVVARPSRWGNPFRVGGIDPDGNRIETNAQAVAWFDMWAEKLPPDVRELQHKNLACWCKEADACHADSLIRLAEKIHSSR